MMLSFTWFKCVDGPESYRGIPMHDDVTRIVKSAAVHHGDKRELPMWSWATYKTHGNRKLENVESVTAFAIDVDRDHGWATIRDFAASLRKVLDLSWCIHSSFSSVPGKRKYRAIAPISRPMTPEEHASAWLGANAALQIGGITVDGQCKNSNRVYYCPARPAGGGYEWAQLNGAVFDVDVWVPLGERVQAAAMAAREPAKPLRIGDLKAFDRASKYIAHVPGAVSGQHGHDATFVLAGKLVHGFGLSDEEALHLLTQWNLTCQPPWKPAELKRKVQQARTSARMQPGFLATAERAR